MRTGSNTRIAIRDANSRCLQYVKFGFANHLVKSGRAIFLDGRSIRMIERPKLSSSSAIKGNQGDAYELAAIDTAPRFFQGGLNRTEHQPAKFEAMKGARVGHQ